MDPSDLPLDVDGVTSVLGHEPRRSQGLQKDFTDDVMAKLVEGMPRGDYKEDEINGLLGRLTVARTHRQNRGRLGIQYESG